MRTWLASGRRLLGLRCSLPTPERGTSLERLSRWALRALTKWRVQRDEGIRFCTAPHRHGAQVALQWSRGRHSRQVCRRQEEGALESQEGEASSLLALLRAAGSLLLLDSHLLRPKHRLRHPPMHPGHEVVAREDFHDLQGQEARRKPSRPLAVLASALQRRRLVLQLRARRRHWTLSTSCRPLRCSLPVMRRLLPLWPVGVRDSPRRGRAALRWRTRTRR